MICSSFIDDSFQVLKFLESLIS